ncbi:hypothetical protein SELMODRAFT_428127 [Selaginella moellendorffii]|uniref:Uncharacterized protein n=1 Tax=Selaginella moellendorffii TaxID=88036 RepID=D8T1U0_SELML|nr:hypothetical protein SELMODRAFT_428127 [Selaginella moellendorffii]
MDLKRVHGRKDAIVVPVGGQIHREICIATRSSFTGLDIIPSGGLPATKIIITRGPKYFKDQFKVGLDITVEVIQMILDGKLSSSSSKFFSLAPLFVRLSGLKGSSMPGASAIAFFTITLGAPFGIEFFWPTFTLERFHVNFDGLSVFFLFDSPSSYPALATQAKRFSGAASLRACSWCCCGSLDRCLANAPGLGTRMAVFYPRSFSAMANLMYLWSNRWLLAGISLDIHPVRAQEREKGLKQIERVTNQRKNKEDLELFHVCVSRQQFAPTVPMTKA